MNVNGGQLTSVNYLAFDQVSTLKVAASIYDITTNTPTLIGSPSALTYQTAGMYIGSFTPVAGHYYLVITAVYLDAGFTTLDPQRAPKAENYDAPTVDTTKLNFNYAAYDEAIGLAVTASITNVTNALTVTQAMFHVAMGVYLGQYAGTVGKTYAVTKYSSDPFRAPGSDSFQCYALNSSVINITNYLSQATLVGPSVTGVFQGHS